MAKPIGIVAMLILLFTGGPALADNHIKRSDLQQIALSKTAIYFHLQDGSVYKGKIVRHRECPTGRYRKVELPKNIHRTFKLHHSEGWTTCQFRDLEEMT